MIYLRAMSQEYEIILKGDHVESFMEEVGVNSS